MGIRPETNLIQRLRTGWKGWLTPRSTDPDAIFRERTIRGIAPVMAFLLFASGIFILATKQTTGFFIPIVGGSTLVILGASFAVSKQRLNLAAVLMFLFPVMASVAALFSWGYLSPAGIIMSYLAVLFGAIVLPRKIVNYLPAGMIILYGLVAFQVGPHGPVFTPLDATSTKPLPQTIEIAILSTLFFGVGYYLLNEFERRRKQLAQLVESLEERVAARTRDLSVAANVSQQVTQVLDLQQLLRQLTELTRTSFGLYHVSIFVVDEATNALELKAGTGEAGQQMVNQHKHFQMDDRGLVPLAARQRRAQVINDVQQSPDHAVNPVLPDTRSEVALPMIIGGTLLGVLDLQSEQVDKFSPDDLKVLTTLAEQVTVAVRNANLFSLAREAREDAEQANRVKSQFLAAMSHELRTPLNAILNFTQFVSTGVCGPVNDDQVDMLDKVVYSGRHLLSLINDVLDISKIESGALKLFIENDVNCAIEAANVASTAHTLLSNKPVQLEVAIADDVPTIAGDKRRIRQIMLNLVSNACKFTETGRVRIELKGEAEEIRFAVLDSGPGIAPEDAELVFEAFRQSAAGLRQGEGTGLGLPISRRLAEAHGGRLWFESKLGQGTTFFVSFPIRSGEALPALAGKEVSHVE